MTNKYLEKLALNAETFKNVLHLEGKGMLAGGAAGLAGGAAGAVAGKKLNKKNPKAGEAWGAGIGSHLAAIPAEIAVAYHHLNKNPVGKAILKKAEEKAKKFKMPTDKPTIATKEELIDKINDNLLKRDQIRADQETQVWKETKRTNDIKDKEVGKMDKLKMNADLTKEKIKAKASVSVAKAKGAKK